MIETALLIWLYTAIGSLLKFLSITFGVVVSLASAHIAIGVMNGDSLPKRFIQVASKLGVAAMIIWSLAAIYPSKNDLKYIVGGAVLVQIAKIDGVEKLPKNVVDAMNATLEALKEGRND